jgi:hypothetical protein
MMTMFNLTPTELKLKQLLEVFDVFDGVGPYKVGHVEFQF